MWFFECIRNCTCDSWRWMTSQPARDPSPELLLASAAILEGPDGPLLSLLSSLL